MSNEKDIAIKGFVENLIKELNDINERELYNENKSLLDVPYLVSVIEQNIEKCSEFINDILKYKYYINGYEKDISDGYTNGKIRILIEKPDNEKESDYAADSYYDFCYYIEFLNDSRMWGYCECSPKDKGYNEKHGCCGHGCDWYAPAFKITKEYIVGYHTWKGDETDYWIYEEQFYTNEKNKSEEIEKLKKEESKKYIQEQILELQKKLQELK